jgi:hypothetical protein
MTTQSTDIKFKSFYDSIGEYKSQMAFFAANTETLHIRWQYMEQEGKNMDVYVQTRPMTYEEYVEIESHIKFNFPEHIYEALDEHLDIK